MSSILNQTSEVLKVELTKHGRKLFSKGIFQPTYFSFYDNSIIYDHSYYGIENEDESSIQNRVMNDSLTLRSLNNTIDILDERLGSSGVDNDFAPAWSLELIKGEIVHNSISSSYYKNKFTLSNIEYNLSATYENNIMFPEVKTDYILIDLQELNVADDFENFEVEIVTFEELSGGKSLILKTEKKNY